MKIAVTTKPFPVRTLVAASPASTRRSKFITREQHRNHPLSYGGDLFKSRLGRQRGGRYLTYKHTTHLVLRSLLAKGPWSFSRTPNRKRVDALFTKFATKYEIKIHSIAYAGNHIHAHIKIPSRAQYKRFIRALTGAIVIAITGISRWTTSRQRRDLASATQGRAMPIGKATSVFSGKLKFWSCRPFTRIVRGIKEFTRVQDYIEINRLETRGYTRDQARFMIAWEKDPPWDPYAQP